MLRFIIIRAIAFFIAAPIVATLIYCGIFAQPFDWGVFIGTILAGAIFILHGILTRFPLDRHGGT